MKKNFILLFICSFLSLGAQGQSYKYQGEVLGGYSAGIGTFSLDRVNLHTVHGVRFNQYLFAGVGLGVDYFYNFDAYLSDIDTKGELTMPIFFDIKGYLPVSPKVSIFASFDIGAGIGLTEGVSGSKGLMFTPAIGTSLKVSSKNAVTLSAGYNYQAWSESGLKVNTDAISLKLGFQF
ncbi:MULTISPECIES: hypothetical protein [Parabacteroides]|uniref:Porin family protein n=1 Tax=Parabacteroides faecis TaxID=1217282 RepID=A0ABR6KRX1_9BACT|nr:MULTISPECIES: hypothetical protein [Parabacteroides]MBB4624154.1 hypothetical protein [Parabacteroides faecis]MBC8620672.1 hypothetical protein [Parabacteroides faecis]RHR93409.1 hypothetical protein DWW23_21565 [Parabacteroides sp. AF14-59]GGK11621.1 hypothetical protein GCM10007084_38710 [Parabacteroides faecis]